MYSELDFDKFLFFDIETVPEYKSFEELQEKNPRKAEIWDEKRSIMVGDKWPELKNAENAKKYWEKAAIYADFNRIVAITIGSAGKKTQPQLISYYGTDEKKIIEQSIVLIDRLVNPVVASDTKLWGYYSNRFDVPTLYKRILANKLDMPGLFYFHTMKPWEAQCKDVYDMWNVMMGERHSSLDMLTTIFDLPSPKEDMDGAMVKYAYYNDKAYQKIGKYCNLDVIATINILRSMCLINPIPEEKFSVIEREFSL